MDTSTSDIYSYPIRSSTAIVIARIVTVQVLIGVISLLVSLPLIVFSSFINQYLPSLILYALITIVLQMINMFIIVTIFLRWINTIYIVRQNEIITQSGIWNIQEHKYTTEHAQRVSVEQSIWGRIFNFGTVKIYNPVLGEHVDLCDIPQPHLYANVIKRFENKEHVQFLPANTNQVEVSKYGVS